MRGPKFTLGGAATPVRPLAKKFSSCKEYFALSKCVQSFDFLALLVSEIWGGPKFILGGPAPPAHP